VSALPVIYDRDTSEKGAAPQRVVSPQGIVYSIKLTAEEIRMQHLLKYRRVFGLASLLLFVVAVVCMVFNVPYEPAMALFTCTVGTLLVFVMKVKDARKT
jgi:NADH:ubiquinone oxidoreductase subunit H